MRRPRGLSRAEAAYLRKEMRDASAARAKINGVPLDVIRSCAIRKSNGEFLRCQHSGLSATHRPKIAYPTEKAARRSAESHVDKGRPYLCPDKDHWHIARE